MQELNTHAPFEGGMLSFVIPVAGKKVQEETISRQDTLQVDTAHINLTQETPNSSQFAQNCAHLIMSLKIFCLITVVTFALIHCEQLSLNVSSNTSVKSETDDITIELPDEQVKSRSFNETISDESVTQNVKYLPVKQFYSNEWWKQPSKLTTVNEKRKKQQQVRNNFIKSHSTIRSLIPPPKFEKRQDYYHDSRGYEPLEGIFSSHGSMLDRNSDFYYILPILLVIGLGSFLIPIISTFFTAMITSGGLAGGCCRRRIRLLERNQQQLFPDKISTLWDSLEQSLSKYSKTFASLADLNDFKAN